MRGRALHLLGNDSIVETTIRAAKYRREERLVVENQFDGFNLSSANSLLSLCFTTIPRLGACQMAPYGCQSLVVACYQEGDNQMCGLKGQVKSHLNDDHIWVSVYFYAIMRAIVD